MKYVMKYSESEAADMIVAEGKEDRKEILAALSQTLTDKRELLASVWSIRLSFGDSAEIDEDGFFSDFVNLRELLPDVAEFLQATTMLGEDRRICGREDLPFGHEAAMALSRAGVEYLPVVTEWIRTLDLEAESGIIELIDEAVKKHEPPQVLDLLAHRMTDCAGQHGGSHAVRIWNDNPAIAEYLEPSERYKEFLETITRLAVAEEQKLNPCDSFEEYKNDYFLDSDEVTAYDLLVDIIDEMLSDDRKRYGLWKNRLRARFLKEMEKAIEGDPDSLERLPTKIEPAALHIIVSADSGIVINGVSVPYNPSLESLENLLGPSRKAEDRTDLRHVWDSLGIELQPDDGRCEKLDGNLGIRFAPDPFAKRIERALQPYSGKLKIQGVDINCGKMTVNEILKRMDPPMPRPHTPGPNCNWILDLPNLQVHYWMKGETPRSRVIYIGFGAPGRVKVITE